MFGIGNDLRFVARMFRRERVFAISVVLILALGLAANTAIFSVVDGVILQPLRFDNPAQLVAIQLLLSKVAGRYPMFPVNALTYSAWSRQAKTLAEIGLIQEGVPVNLTGSGEPTLLTADSVTSNLFDVLGVQPQFGRNFSLNAGRTDGDHEAILTNILWRTRFHADPSIVGKAITLNGSLYTIVGVLSPTVDFPQGKELIPMIGPTPKADLFIPLVLSREQLESTGEFNFAAIGRLKTGVSQTQAVAELDAILRRLPDEISLYPQLRTAVMPLRDMVVRSARRGLWTLFAAVFIVLLIICVDLANLILTRSISKAHETAIRSALGASRGRLVRETLTETVALGLLGGMLGLLLTRWILRVLLASLPSDLPRQHDIHLNVAVLVFTLTISVMVGLFAGLLPAWKTATTDPRDALTVTRGGSGDSRARLRSREVLVGGETALSVMLLVAGGLLLASFSRLQEVPKGFRVQHILSVSLDLPQAEYGRSQQRSEFWHTAVSTASTLPSVNSAALIDVNPLGGTYNYDSMTLPGDTRPAAEQPWANYRRVSPSFFKVLGIPLLRGRDFSWADEGSGDVIISEATAKAVWPGRDPIGQRFGEGVSIGFQVVGVVSDTRSISLVEAPALIVYQLYDGSEDTGLHAELLIRTELPATAVAPELRQAIWKIDPTIPVPNIRTMREIVSASLATQRFEALLTSIFAGVALLLACLGIYGVASYSVTRRTHEIGVRMALGATVLDIYRLILTQSLRPVILGLVIGVAGSLSLGRFMSSFLFDVHPSDPVVVGIVIVVLLLTATAACSVPAHRAGRLAPSEAIRIE